MRISWTESPEVNLHRLRKFTLTELKQTLGDVSAVALLDIPRHNNAGDTLIWLGERQYLSDLGIRIAYEADRISTDHCHIKTLPPRVPILLHGGGNLGDLYPAHEEYRREVVRLHPERRIVILPQSVYYEDSTEMQLSREAYATHPDLQILIRDHSSLRRFQSSFPGLNVKFCPDLAPGYRPQRPVRTAKHTRIMTIIRNDAETGAPLQQLSVSPRVDFGDWRHSYIARPVWCAIYVHGAVIRRIFERSQRVALARTIRWTNVLVHRAIRALNQRTIRRTVDNQRLVVTNRLHGHIACSLYGVEHIVVDNSYGKIGAVFDGYSKHIGVSRMAENVAEVESAIGEYLE